MISESSVSSRDMESPDNDDDQKQQLKSATQKRKSNDGGRKRAIRVEQSDDEVKVIGSEKKKKKKKKKELNSSKELDKGTKEQHSSSSSSSEEKKKKKKDKKNKQKKDKDNKKTLSLLTTSSSSSTSHMVKTHKDLVANKIAGESFDSKGSRKSSHKRRFEEMIIDGLTISAFKTWEDLQDEVNERLAEEAKKMRNRTTGDHSLKGSHSSMDASEGGHSSSSGSPSVTSNRDQSSPQQSQLPNQQQQQQQQQQREFELQSSSSNQAKSSSYEDAGLREALEAKVAAERHLMEVQDRLQQQEQRKKKHELSRQHQDNIGREFVARQRFSTNFASSTPNRPHIDTSFYPFQPPLPPPPPPYPQTRAPLAPPPLPPFSGTQHSHGSQYNFNNTNNEFKPLAKEGGGGPSVPIHQQPSYMQSRGPPQMNTQQQQNFQQYLNSQLYQQQQQQQQQQSRDTTSTHQSHFVPPPVPPHMPPHMNHSYVSPHHHLQQQNHLHHSSLMATGSLHQHPFASPYTVTDTIISRQTSIIPPNLATMNAALAASRYPQAAAAAGALEHSSLSLLGGVNSGYIPSPTERSFMEFARSYASASNISSMMPGANFGPPPGGLMHPSSLDRFAMEHRIASSFGGGGGGLSDPMSRFGMPGYGIEAARSAVNAASSFYPPNFYR